MKKSEFKAFKRKDGRYTVVKPGGQLVHGEEKVKFLVGKGLIKQSKASAKKDAPAE